MGGHRVGIGSYAFRYAVGIDGFTPPTPMSTLDFVKAAYSLGAGGVQLCENLSYCDLPESSLMAVKRFCDENEMFIEIGMRDCRPENLETHLSIARLMGSDLIRLVLGAPSNTPEPDGDELEWRSIRVLKDLVPVLESEGVRIAVENHFDLRTERLVRIIEQVDSDAVGFVLDTTNGIGFVEKPEQTLEALLPRLLSVHLKDYTMEKVEAGYVMRGCALGEGWLDYQGILERVLSVRPDASIILELTARRKDSQSSQETIRREAELIRTSFEVMTQTVDFLSRTSSKEVHTR